MSNNKRKILKTAVHFAVSAIVVFSFVAVSSCSREKTTVDKSADKASPVGPIVDPNFKSTVLDELEIDNNDPQSLALLGDQYFETRQYAKAIEIYEKVLKLNPNDVDTFNDIGLAYFYSGKSNIAVDRLKRGTEVVPSYQRVWLSLGFVLLSEGRGREAKPALQKAVELDPESAMGREARKMLGSIKQ
jgi:tetratricopeptide (TPR) repeat protein